MKKTTEKRAARERQAPAVDKRDLAWFVEAVLSANDEIDVSQALIDFKEAHPSLGFVPLGTANDMEDASGKSTIAKNQSAYALIALKELITNAYDAEIDYLGAKHHVETKKAPNLIAAWRSVKEALAANGELLPEDQMVLSRCNDATTGATSITVADRGSGQPNSAMVGTMLSLSSGKDKPKRNDSYGSLGQGSSGVHNHAGKQGYKLILTSTGKDAKTGRTQWSVGLVRRRPSGVDGTFIVEWMSLDPKNLAVPSFDAPEIEHLRRKDGSVWPGKLPTAKGGSGIRPAMDRGTVVKVFSYDGAKRGAGTQWVNDLVDPFLTEMPHPICCLDMDVSDANSERRKNSHGADHRYARGAKDRLRPRSAKVAEERYADDSAEEDDDEESAAAPEAQPDPAHGKPPAAMPQECRFSFKVPNPAFESFDPSLVMDGSDPIEPPQHVDVDVLAVFSPAKKGKGGDWKRKVKSFASTRAFFSYFGQMHRTGVKTMDESALFTEILDLPALKDEVAFFVDLDRVGKDFFNSLYMSSRDRVVNNDWYAAFSSSFRDALRSQLSDDTNPIRQWELFCRERESARNKIGLLKQDGSGGWKVAETFAKLSGISRSLAKRLRMEADEPMPDRLAGAPAGIAVETTAGGIPARVSGEGKPAAAGSYMDKGAGAGAGVAGTKALGKRKAEALADKPKAADKPSATREFGKRHNVRAAGRAVKGINGEPAAPAARIARAELQHPDGSMADIDAGLLDIGVSSLDAHGHPCYDVGVAERKGRKQAVEKAILAARMAKEGACIVVTLALAGEDGRETMVHAKMAWEAKDKLLAAGKPKKSAQASEKEEQAPPLLVQARFASLDGRAVHGLSTAAFSEIEFDPGQLCSVVYNGVDRATGAHALVATLNAEDGAMQYILESGREGKFIPGLLDGISSAAANMVRRRDFYMSLPPKPSANEAEAEADKAKRAAYKPGMSAENIKAYLEWPNVMASEGFCPWDALALDVAAKCSLEPGPAGTKKPR